MHSDVGRSGEHQETFFRINTLKGWSTTLPTFIIYKGEEGGAEPAGSVSISIEAGSVGLGTILPSTSVDFYQGEQLSSVVLRLLQNSGLFFFISHSLF